MCIRDRAKATQKVYSVEAAKAKLFAAETAMAVTTEVVQLFGGYGYIREYDVEPVSYTHLYYLVIGYVVKRKPCMFNILD